MLPGKLYETLKCLDEILKIFFVSRQQELFNVLKAYTIYNPTVGYCQAQAPVAAFLLLHMPAEQAFWCYVSICDNLVRDYYSEGMVNINCNILKIFVICNH